MPINKSEIAWDEINPAEISWDEPKKPKKEKLNKPTFIEDLPRAGGVALRNVLEGVEGTVDFLGSPIRAAAVAMGFNDPAGGPSDLADYLNLPKPANKMERILSEAEKFMAGGMGLMGAAGKAQNAFQAGSVANKALGTMAANPGNQLASMVGGGAAYGASKEATDSPLLQFGASLLGGFAPTMAANVGQKAATSGKNALQGLLGNAPKMNIQIDTAINSAVQSKGIPANAISSAVRNKLRDDVKAAMSTGQVDSTAIKRLVDYRLTGLTPTAGPLSNNPSTYTQQANLAKIGANSSDPNLQRLSQIQSQNNKKLIENLNTIGAGAADDQIGTGKKVIDYLDELNTSVKEKTIDPLYKAARETTGRSASLDPYTFTNKANDMLDEKLLSGFLPSGVRGHLNKIAKGETPLTVDVAEQLKTTLFNLQKNLPKFGKDGQMKQAINTVRSALEETPLLESSGQGAIKAFNKARAANKSWMKIVERVPALKAVREGVEPDKFVNDFITGTGKNATIKAVSNLSKVTKRDGAAHTVIRNYLARYLKEKAINKAADEVGKFSQSSYNKALDGIGERKLRMFFDDEELQLLKAIGRVSSYEQVQPSGSAVNNSNTAATGLSSILDWLGNVQLLRKIPFGAQLAGGPAKSVSQNIQAGRVLDIPQSITTHPGKIGIGPLSPIMSGAAFSQDK